MQAPSLPTEDQMRSALRAGGTKLIKRNLRVVTRLLKGESLGQVADSCGLSRARVHGIFDDVTGTLRKSFFTATERQEEFASYTALRLTDYRKAAQAVVGPDTRALAHRRTQ